MTSKDLWNLCDRHGKVADVYIARKLSKLGKRFAFVRFLKSKDHDHIVDDLNRVWIGNFHLFAIRARFGRTQEVREGLINQVRNKDSMQYRVETGKQPIQQQIMPNVNKPRSFALVLLNNMNEHKSNQQKINHIVNQEEKQMKLGVSDMLMIPDSSTLVICKVRDISVIENLYKRCYNEGFNGLNIAYLGGE